MIFVQKIIQAQTITKIQAPSQGQGRRAVWSGARKCGLRNTSPLEHRSSKPHNLL